MAKPTRNVGASVRARLLNLARDRGQPFDLVITRYALERLLYRLSESAHRNELASRADPDHPESQHQRDRHHAGGGDLPVTFAENPISVTLVPFLPRFEIDAAFDADASSLAVEH